MVKCFEHSNTLPSNIYNNGLNWWYSGVGKIIVCWLENNPIMANQTKSNPTVWFYHSSVNLLLISCLYSQTAGLVSSTTSQHSLLTVPLEGFSQEIRQTNSENVKILSDSVSHCEDLGIGLKGACQEAGNWGAVAKRKTVCIADQQRAFLKSKKEHLQRICKV